MKSRWSMLYWLASSFLFLGTSAAAQDGIVRVDDVVVEFAAAVEVPSRQSGPVAELRAQQNQWVSRGSRIAKLDDTALVIRRRAATLRHDSAQLILRDNIEIQFAQTALDEARAELADSQAASDRVNGAIARNQLRRTKIAVERAELELARAEKQRRQAEIDLQLRAADLAMIDHELDQLQCLAPIDGIVLRVHRELGEWTHAGEPLVTIADASVLHLHALVDADSLDPNQCMGLPVSVHWQSEPGQHGETPLDRNTHRTASSLNGKVTSVDPTRLPGNRFRLHAEVENQRLENRQLVSTRAPRPKPAPVAQGWLLVPGMDVTIDIHCAGISEERRD